MALGFFPGFVRRPLPPVLLLSNSNGSGIFVAIAHRRKITDLTTAGTADSHSIYSSNLDFCMLTPPQLYPSCLSKEGGGFSAHLIQNVSVCIILISHFQISIFIFIFCTSDFQENFGIIWRKFSETWLNLAEFGKNKNWQHFQRFLNKK